LLPDDWEQLRLQLSPCVARGTLPRDCDWIRFDVRGSFLDYMLQAIIVDIICHSGSLASGKSSTLRVGSYGMTIVVLTSGRGSPQTSSCNPCYRIYAERRQRSTPSIFFLSLFVARLRLRSTRGCFGRLADYESNATT
jgi:hypothetical protein